MGRYVTTPLPAYNILVAEDDAEFRRGFENAVRASGELRLLASCTGFADAVDALRIHGSQVHVALVDLCLGDGSGIDLLRLMSNHYAHIQPLAVTVLADTDSVVAALKAGACGYLLKDAADSDLLAGIRTTLAGGAAITPVVARKLLNVFAQVPAASNERLTAADGEEALSLSPRQEDVLRLVAKGMNVPEIAVLHGVSRHTVETQIKRIYQKLGVSNRVEAVLEAQRMRLI